jgi:hypothetical protein
MDYLEFRSEEKYVYYCLEFDELILGKIKHSRLYVNIVGVRMNFFFVGEL